MMEPKTPATYRVIQTRNGRCVVLTFIAFTVMWLAFLAPEGSTNVFREGNWLVPSPPAVRSVVATDSNGVGRAFETAADGPSVMAALKADLKASGATMAKVMFVGDSITTGVAAKNERKFKVRRAMVHPKQGTCSYRPGLLRKLQADTELELEAVGPYDSAFAGPSPKMCTSEDEMHYSNHAATWGIKIAQVLRGESEKKRSRSAGGPNAATDKSATAAGEGGDAAAWTAAYRPDLVIVLLGTNDLNDGIPAEQFVDNRMSLLVDALLSNAEVSSETKVSRRCAKSGRVAVSTLLPRADSLARKVHEANAALIQRVAMCRNNATFAEENRHALCHPCVSLIDGGGEVNAAAAMEPGKHTYDGLHPNAAGEAHIADVLAAGLINAKPAKKPSDDDKDARSQS